MEEAEELRGRGDDDEKETAETQSTQRAPKVPETEFTTKWLMTQRPTQRKIGGIKPKA